MSLDELGLKYQTDKASTCHNYLQYYEMFFSPLKDKVKNLLEIGVWEGASLKMWKEYFVNADVVGIDIEDKKQFNSERIRTIICDQSSHSQLMNLFDLHPSFDIIIDDGSHIGEHQLISFNTLFPLLKSGGLYCIEDALCNYDPRWNEKVKIIDRIKEMVGEVQMNGKIPNSFICANKQEAVKKYDATYFERNIEWLFTSCGLVIIKKM